MNKTHELYKKVLDAGYYSTPKDLADALTSLYYYRVKDAKARGDEEDAKYWDKRYFEMLDVETEVRKALEEMEKGDSDDKEGVRNGDSEEPERSEVRDGDADHEGVREKGCKTFQITVSVGRPDDWEPSVQCKRFHRRELPASFQELLTRELLTSLFFD